MKANEIKSMELDALQNKAQEMRAELFHVRIKHAAGQLEKTDQLKSLRRDIARVETMITTKKRAKG